MLVLLATLGVAGLHWLTSRYDRTVAKEQLLDPAARNKRTDLDGALNYLLIGSDHRPGANPEDQRSDSILIVHAANELLERGSRPADAIEQACRSRFRAVLMTSIATVVGLLPLAFAIGTGGEAYVPMARAIIGGMLLSVITGVFGVPALWYVMRRRNDHQVGA